MSNTYMLHIRGEGNGPSPVEPVLCGSRLELLAEAKAALARHPDCERVDVYLGTEELFEVMQPGETD